MNRLMGNGQAASAWSCRNAGPAIAILGFPTKFQLRRVTSDRRISAEETVDRANFKGSGCIRPAWILPSDDVRLIIRVDDAANSR